MIRVLVALTVFIATIVANTQAICSNPKSNFGDQLTEIGSFNTIKQQSIDLLIC